MSFLVYGCSPQKWQLIRVFLLMVSSITRPHTFVSKNNHSYLLHFVELTIVLQIDFRSVVPK